jgi:DNA-binding MurR/RpiR family transcriptional regulator
VFCRGRGSSLAGAGASRLRARRIVGALADEAQVRLFRYGVPVTACREPYIARMTAATLKPGDVFLALSATGRTPR